MGALCGELLFVFVVLTAFSLSLSYGYAMQLTFSRVSLFVLLFVHRAQFFDLDLWGDLRNDQ